MLNKLFGSELRARILKKILASPEEKYYSQALGRDLKVALNPLRRELDNLEKLGLIVALTEIIAADGKKPKKEKKFFMVNRNFLLFNELKALFSKAQLFFVQEFLGRLAKITNLKYFVLTGQFSGNSTAITDMLIIGRLRREKFLPLIADLEKKLGREINFTIMDEAEFHYRRDIMDIFLYNILNNNKIVIIDNLELMKPKVKVPKTENK
ncbi:MAG: hypothetical protein NTX66_00120 [Candidatus Falkowbacteria bacterium]|nr:hypothetical protein [Candidatus Falkowbacteria bacterium]